MIYPGPHPPGQGAEVWLNMLVLIGRFSDGRLAVDRLVAHHCIVHQWINDLTLRGQPALCLPDHPWRDRWLQVGYDPQTS
jgi:hypothetical protein